MNQRVVLIIFCSLLCQIMFAVNPQSHKLKHLDSKKKLKFKLQDGSTFKGFIVKTEGDQIYTVPTRLEKRLASKNNCKDCLITSVHQIEKIKVKKLAPVFAITFLFLGFALSLAIAALSSTAEKRGNFSLSTSFMILLPIFLLIGFGIGSFLDEFI